MKGRASSALFFPASLALAAATLARHFGARAAGLAQADGNRLFAARHLPARSARPERAALALAHRTLHFFRCFPAVFRHRLTSTGWSCKPHASTARKSAPVSCAALAMGVVWNLSKP